MPLMSPGGLARSLHDKLVIGPVRRIVAQELADTSARMLSAFDEAHDDLRRILSDLADANDQVAEAIGRSLTRLGAEIDVLHDRLPAADGTGHDPEPPL
jgi:hypothetical protein